MPTPVAVLLEENPMVSATMYNSAILIGPSGELVGVQRKMHVTAEEKHYFCPGNAFEAFVTDLGKIGILICADIGFPESARVLSLRGAEIICVPLNKDEHAIDREMFFRLVSCRAFENENFFNRL